MNYKNKICTDIAQSKKLIELEVNINSADMHYVRQKTDYMGNPVDGKWSVTKYGNTNSKYANYFVQNFSSYETLPAWSLSALIDILSDTITDEDGTVFDLNIKKNFIEYYNPSMGALYATYHSIIAEDLVDAAFEMICWLKENGKL